MLHQGGIASAIRHYASGFFDRTGTRVEPEAGPGVGRMDQDVELALFYVVQESFTNIHRHSGSAVARVRIERAPEVVVPEPLDEGCGTPRLKEKTKRPFDWTRGVGIKSTMSGWKTSAAKCVSNSVSSVRPSEREYQSMIRDKHKLQILLADDHEVIRRGVKEVLRTRSCPQDPKRDPRKQNSGAHSAPVGATRPPRA